MIRIRAVLYMTRSYIPWVCYWTFSAFHMQFAPIFSLLIVLCILLIEYREKRFALMDLVMFGYALIAIIFNYLTPFEWFLTGDGYFGYGTLTAMAFFSLILRKPFAQYYIDKECIQIERDSHVVILFSGIWCTVFFISTLIFLLIQTPVAAVISSNVFVLLGILSSLRILYIPKMHKQ